MNKYQQCTRCVMDTSASGIVFNKVGTCNYCNELIEINKVNDLEIKNLDMLIDKIKNHGKDKEYDCIVGVSGGVDSSYSLYLAKKHGLRVLAVHMDNGWNSELAVNNIKNLVEILNVDLYTHVIEWEEYKNLMQSFFDADVIDVELLYDNAMLAVNYQQASKYGIKYILSGSNTNTEGMRMPRNWNWHKLDKKNIISLSKLRNIKLKTFPIIGRVKHMFYSKIKKIEWVAFLDYVDYQKQDCMDFLVREFDFKPYPYKHYESIFTRFYQGYILPTKFKVDKRKLHLSTMIVNGQMKREDAINDLNKIPYISKIALEEDKEYFLKKLEWKNKDLKNYVARKEKPHTEYGSEILFWNKITSIVRKIFRK